jgi:hypothetical protein
MARKKPEPTPAQKVERIRSDVDQMLRGWQTDRIVNLGPSARVLAITSIVLATVTAAAPQLFALALRPVTSGRAATARPTRAARVAAR